VSTARAELQLSLQVRTGPGPRGSTTGVEGRAGRAAGRQACGAGILKGSGQRADLRLNTAEQDWRYLARQTATFKLKSDSTCCSLSAPHTYFIDNSTKAGFLRRGDMKAHWRLIGIFTFLSCFCLSLGVGSSGRIGDTRQQYASMPLDVALSSPCQGVDLKRSHFGKFGSRHPVGFRVVTQRMLTVEERAAHAQRDPFCIPISLIFLQRGSYLAIQAPAETYGRLVSRGRKG
jgi:hypothetical protein